VRQPGCKFDQLPVIEGPQGSGKSSAIRILASEEFFCDQAEVLSKDDKGVQETLTGVWLYEFSEMSGFGKREDEHRKSFLSRTHDKARAAYGRRAEMRARQCIFWGTTNRSDYLTDDTGNRRYWPVESGKIDLEGLKRDRDQLWAEASAAEATGEPLVLEKELDATAAELATSRLETDPWEDILAGVKSRAALAGSIDREGGEQRVSSEFLLTVVLGLDPSKMRGGEGKRLKKCMQRQGWQGPITLRIKGGTASVKGYWRRLEEGESHARYA
jgi:predicted P-loop ATPase